MLVRFSSCDKKRFVCLFDYDNDKTNRCLTNIIQNLYYKSLLKLVVIYRYSNVIDTIAASITMQMVLNKQTGDKAKVMG